MSRHRARKGRLRRWLHLSHASLSAPEPARRPLRLLTPHMDAAPADTDTAGEPKTSVPFDGRARPATGAVPPDAGLWTPPVSESAAAPAPPEQPAEPEPDTEIPDADLLDRFGVHEREYAAPFAHGSSAGGV